MRRRRPTATQPPTAPRPRRVVATPAGPVPCLVVHHPGARRLTLRLRAGELRLTVPARTRERDVAAFLAGHAGWIAARIAAAPPARPVADGDALALLDQVLTLRHTHAGGPAGAHRDGSLLHVRTPPGTPPDAALERWYRAEAARVLAPRAHARAALLDATVAGITIRDPRSRWGSCSAAGRLSLSWRLMLAPEWVAHHVVDHEVCHLVRLDHSPAFWSLLRDLDPRTDEARSWLTAHGPRLHDGPVPGARAGRGPDHLRADADPPQGPPGS